MKTNLKAGFLAGSAVALFVLATTPTVVAQDATETAKKAAETIFKNPELQGILKSVKENPDAALKNVSSMAKEQMNRFSGATSTNGGVPATRSQVPPATVPAPAAKPDMQIPEPVARGERPPAPTYTTVTEPTLKNTLPTPTQIPAPSQNTGIPGLPVPAPRPLTPRYTEESGIAAQPKKTAAGAQEMQIDADESIMNERDNILTFTGNVVLQHPSFNLTGDKLVIYLNDDQPMGANGAAAADDNDAPFKKAIATGGMVEIVRRGLDGKTQIAKARKATYDGATKDMTLSGGPPTLQSGSGLINPSSPQAVIILKGNGRHEVKGGRSSFTIPVKGGAAIGGLPGGSLDSMKNKDR